VSPRALSVAVDARVLGQRGVGRYLSNLLDALDALEQPHRFHLFLGRQSDRARIPKGAAFTVHEPLRGGPAWVEQVGLPRAAMRLDCDLLFYPDNTGALRPGLPMVQTLHDTMWRRPLSQAIAKPTLRQRVQDRYRKAVCPAAARAATRVITISAHSEACLRDELGLRPPKLSVIAEAADPFFRQALPAIRAQRLCHGLDLDAPFVLASGAADTRKNIDRLILAFAQASAAEPRLRKSLLAIASLRPGEAATTTYARTAREAGVEGRVRFLGYVSDLEMKALYQRALCFAFPSLWEGFGLPVLEAYALGCPVLVARAGALPEVAGKAAVYADPLSASSLADGLREASFGAKRAQRRSAGKAVERRYTWKACAQAHLRVFAQATGQA
jgi:glycosyltransferase involved in cell wall biosynthesis